MKIASNRVKTSTNLASLGLKERICVSVCNICNMWLVKLFNDISESVCTQVAACFPPSHAWCRRVVQVYSLMGSILENTSTLNAWIRRVRYFGKMSKPESNETGCLTLAG